MKRAGDNKIGVLTQCVVASTLQKTDPSTLTNVCLKINAKLGGTNSTISRYSIHVCRSWKSFRFAPFRLNRMEMERNGKKTVADKKQL